MARRKGQVRKRLVGFLCTWFGLTAFIDEVRYGRPDRTPRDP